MVDFCGHQGMEVRQHVSIIDIRLSMGVLGSDDNMYRVPIILICVRLHSLVHQ